MPLGRRGGDLYPAKHASPPPCFLPFLFPYPLERLAFLSSRYATKKAHANLSLCRRIVYSCAFSLWFCGSVGLYRFGMVRESLRFSEVIDGSIMCLLHSNVKKIFYSHM